jgi:hypothetical protein
MSSRKACGVDGIPAEILKHSPKSFQENLRHLINVVFASEFKLPKDTLLSKVVLLYKKGDPSLLGNYRPIALLTSTYQLMNLILAGRLQDLARGLRILLGEKVHAPTAGRRKLEQADNHDLGS